MENRYNLQRNISESRSFHTQEYGIESLARLAAKIWSLVPTDIKHFATLNIFKNKKIGRPVNTLVNSARHIFLTFVIYKI